MAQDNIVYCPDGYAAQGYKYTAVIWESSSTLGQCYASNNLQDLKGFVYNEVRQLYDTARGEIYYSSIKYGDSPLYMCWREGCKTYKKTF